MRSDTQELVPVQWRTLGEPPPCALAAARQELHWGVQVVSALGLSYLEAAADDSHANLGWVTGHGALAGRQVEVGGTPCQAALRFTDLSLLLLAEDGESAGELELAGRSLDDAYAWLADAVAHHTGCRQPLVRPGYAMPAHPLAAGGRFSGVDAAARAELARWYRNADHLLSWVACEFPGASPVRVWPHHFDLAMLLVFDAGKDAKSARQLGVGLSPGDEHYPEPYWYVTPNVCRNGITLPALRGGEWRMNGWFGAVLLASDLVAAGGGAAQARWTEDFLRSAIQGGRSLLGLSD